MFVWNKYIKEIDDKIENNRDECSDYEIAMMPISQLQGIDVYDPNQKIEDGIYETFDHYFSSIFDQKNIMLCDVIDGDFDCLCARYILCDGKDTNTCVLIHIYPKKGEIVLDKYISDCHTTWNEQKQAFKITDYENIRRFINDLDL